ncbi:MAG: kinase/pyrophosphorylase [Deltaproteobacteria bacterium]|nr:kinase/pyrophosphorylase [Deltaproteobacteria bacterium]MBW2680938.1 kinase/pyrophosphorylase [Deltaproteobacteria bacterium]
MSLPKKKVNVFIVSDATGITAEMVAGSALAQFRQVEPIFKRFPNVKTEEQIKDILENAEKLEAFVIYSLVSQELRRFFRTEKKKKNVRAMDLLGPLLRRMVKIWNVVPLLRPGIFKGIDEESARLAESINFTLKHDDGQRIETLDKADLIILGISRTSKTPTSLYISCNYNLKVANFPIIPGEQPPKTIFTLRLRKVGFTISPARAAFLRQERLKYLESTDYTDIESIRRELKYSQKIFRDIQGLKVLDVTNKSIEEIATDIMGNGQY